MVFIIKINIKVYKNFIYKNKINNKYNLKNIKILKQNTNIHLKDINKILNYIINKNILKIKYNNLYFIKINITNKIKDKINTMTI